MYVVTEYGCVCLKGLTVWERAEKLISIAHPDFREELIREAGGLHKFMSWDKPILTDSGGFQVFSLAGLRKIKEEGVHFNSHIDGRKIFMGPEESMQIQSNLASTIAMAFDECPSSVADRAYMRDSVARTTRWLKRCKAEMDRLNTLPDTINPHQMLFGINQGGIYEDIRIEHAKQIVDLDLDGYAVGGLAVGESHEEMYRILDAVVPYLPEQKPTYLMGVGTPVNILEGIERGVDMFDCVMPTRNGRNGMLFTKNGIMNMRNKKWEDDYSPIEAEGASYVDTMYSRAYLRHLFHAQELLAMQIASIHNLAFYLWLAGEARKHIIAGDFSTWKPMMVKRLSTRL